VDMITATGTALVLASALNHVLDRRLTVGDLTVILFYTAWSTNRWKAISSTAAACKTHSSRSR